MRYADDRLISRRYSVVLLYENSTFSKYFTDVKPIKFLHQDLNLPHNTDVQLKQEGGNKVKLHGLLAGGAPIFVVNDDNTRYYIKREGPVKGANFEITQLDKDGRIESISDFTDVKGKTRRYNNPYDVMRLFARRAIIYHIVTNVKPEGLRAQTRLQTITNNRGDNKLPPGYYNFYMLVDIVKKRLELILGRIYKKEIDDVRQGVVSALDDIAMYPEEKDVLEIVKMYRTYLKGITTGKVDIDRVTMGKFFDETGFHKAEYQQNAYGIQNEPPSYIDFAEQPEKAARYGIKLIPLSHVEGLSGIDKWKKQHPVEDFANKFLLWYTKKLVKPHIQKQTDELSSLI